MWHLARGIFRSPQKYILPTLIRMLQNFSYLFYFSELIQGLDEKVASLQENYDQLEGYGTQEVAKIKHLVSV